MKQLKDVVLKEMIEKNEVSKPLLNYGFGIWAEAEKKDHLARKEKKYIVILEDQGHLQDFETNKEVFMCLKEGMRGTAIIQKGKIISFDEIK